MKKSIQWILLLIAIISVGILFGPNIFADFWLMDDHEILKAVDSSKGRLGDFFRLISLTEIGNFGHSNRFRPGYYTIYVLESLVWGAKPFLWYLFRLIMCTTFVFACLRVVHKYFGFLNAILFVGLVFSYSYWNDVWSRLGPGESYCAFGLGLFLIGFVELIAAKPRREWFWSLLVFLGVLIGAGGKENFLLLIFPVAGLAFYRYRKGVLTKPVAVSLGLSAIYIFFITGQLVYAFANGASDVHAVPVTFQSRLQMLTGLFSLRPFNFSLITFFLASAILLFRNRFLEIKKFERSLLGLAVIAFSCLFLVFTQVVFYHGEWPANVRFDFPGMMVSPVLIISIIALLNQVLMTYSKRVPAYILPLLVFLYASPSIFKGWQNVRSWSWHNVQRTQETKSKVQLISETLKKDTSVPLVFESYHAHNYEFIVSLKTFLRVAGVTNPLLVRAHNFSPETQAVQLYKQLAGVIIGWQQQDQVQLSQMTKCYSVHFSGRERTNCEDLADF